VRVKVVLVPRSDRRPRAAHTAADHTQSLNTLTKHQINPIIKHSKHIFQSELSLLRMPNPNLNEFKQIRITSIRDIILALHMQHMGYLNMSLYI